MSTDTYLDFAPADFEGEVWDAAHGAASRIGHVTEVRDEKAYDLYMALRVMITAFPVITKDVPEAVANLFRWHRAQVRWHWYDEMLRSWRPVSNTDTLPELDVITPEEARELIAKYVGWRWDLRVD